VSRVLKQVTQTHRAWLSNDILASLEEEASRFAPNETGGVLLGYWTVDTDEPVITKAFGSGPRAVHGRYHYVPDYEHDALHIARAYEESGRTLHYLGDWHTHPGQPGFLSRKDRRTLVTIARCPEAYSPRPLMLILAFGDPWRPFAWTLRLTRRWMFCQRAIVESREIALL